MVPRDPEDEAPEVEPPIPPVENELQRRRLARELAGELDGLFGIDLPDIEEAIGRLYSDFASGSYDERERLRRMPELLRQVMGALDRVHELAALIHQQEQADALDESPDEAPVAVDPLAPTLQHVIDLVENELQRLRRMQPGSRET